MRRLVLAAALAALGCGAPLEDDGPVDDAPSKADDPGYRVTLGRQWTLLPDALTAGDTTLHVEVEAPPSVQAMRAAVDGNRSQRMSRNASGTFTVELALDSITSGVHSVRVAPVGTRRAVGSATFRRSAVLYAVVSTDWDDSRFSDDYLTRMERLRTDHPALRITHFFNPFHYTDPQITVARKQQLEDWVKQQRDQHGDELGVHIHPWCHYVTAAGVPCHVQPSYVSWNTTGYTTHLASYTEDQQATLFDYAVTLFQEHGLGRPTSFRAGGWTADGGTLRALARAGFTLDSSAVPPDHLGEWRGTGLYEFVVDHWPGITEAAQPYWPASTAQAQPEGDSSDGVGILEVPDNGTLVDYVTGADMRHVLDQVFPAQAPLASPTVFQVGYHPPDFSDAFLQRMQEALSAVDALAYAQDLGPAMYVTLAELQRVFPRR